MPSKTKTTTPKKPRKKPVLRIETRVKRELERLTELFCDVPEGQGEINKGLLERAAYLRIQLEDYEKDLTKNGYTESFQQSDRVDPYERERPVARLYNTAVKNYAAILKQLGDLLPDEVPEKQKAREEVLQFSRSG